MLIRIVIISIIILIVEYYFYQALKSILSSKYHRYLLIAQVLWLLIVLLSFISIIFYQPHQWQDWFRLLLSIFAIIEISKLFGSIFMLLDDIRRIFVFYLSYLHILPDNSKHQILQHSRSQFLSYLGIIFTFIPFVGFIYGIFRGAYNFKIHYVRLKFSELPPSFNGLKIVQISDLHLGSFFSTKPVEKIVELVMNEEPDIIFFTGDLVNNLYEETLPYKNFLSQLKAPLGVYSILGNHDYGDYIYWNNIEDKQKNLKQIIQSHKEMGWNILLNENKIIQHNDESIAIIGVENWGGNLHFPKYGDLSKAIQGVESIPFKILLSHDPSHWDIEVSKHYPDIQLTLSGHTHGFQFGVEYHNIKWSPVKWVYKQWAGLYQKKQEKMYASNQQMKNTDKQYLYVNRGVGFIGYPGRLGIWPEITVIQLYSV